MSQHTIRILKHDKHGVFATQTRRICCLACNKPKPVITTLIFQFPLGNPFTGCLQPLAIILPVIFFLTQPATPAKNDQSAWATDDNQSRL